jgi:tRNA A-37 threonylcarbamoyl transferase component Bud32
MIAPVLGDLYLYTGAERTRSYREFRLLTELKRRGLPVPAPVAARYERAGALFYRADLITEELEGTETLAHLLTQRKLPAQEWHAIGSTVGSFHLHGVEHADLNAHNILLDSIGRVYVLDFDRGQIRSPGPWHVRVLDRLRRSLEKIRASDPNATYREADWQMLIEGHATTAGTQSP